MPYMQGKKVLRNLDPRILLDSEKFKVPRTLLFLLKPLDRSAYERFLERIDAVNEMRAAEKKGKHEKLDAPPPSHRPRRIYNQWNGSTQQYPVTVTNTVQSPCGPTSKYWSRTSST